MGKAFLAEGKEDEGIEDGGDGEGDEDPEIMEVEAKAFVVDVDPALRMVSVYSRLGFQDKLYPCRRPDEEAPDLLPIIGHGNPDYY